MKSIIVGLEPTGHYWFNFADWLIGEHVELVLVNPLTTKRNKENRGEAKREISRLLKQFEEITTILTQIEQEVFTLLQEIPIAKQLRSIKGMGWTLIAAILAGTGDLRLYAHGQQVLRMAGLNLAEESSGKSHGKIVLSKRGRSDLRKSLYMVVVVLCVNHPSFRQWHRHNVEMKRMQKRHSYLKLVGKLARILIAMAKNGMDFDERKASPPLAA